MRKKGRKKKDEDQESLTGSYPAPRISTIKGKKVLRVAEAFTAGKAKFSKKPKKGAKKKSTIKVKKKTTKKTRKKR